MGSGVSRHLPGCFRSSADPGGENKHVTFETGPLDETLGHSFCYVRSSSPAAGDGDGSPRSSSAFSAETVFKAISGASVSANSSTPLPIYDNAYNSSTSNSRSHFRSSSSFSAIPLQLAGGGGAGGEAAASGPLDRGFFLSGPIERGGALSGPLDSSSVPFSGPIVKKTRKRGISGRMMIKKASLLRRSLSEKNRPWVVPLRSFPGKKCDRDGDGNDQEIDGGSIQWAHGKAGEDRVHVVVSESQRWLFVGIYDGFNGPEAPEYLVENLYRAVFNELKGLFWEEIEEEEEKESVREIAALKDDSRAGRRLWEFLAEEDEDGGLEFSGSGRFAFSMAKLRSGFGSWRKEEKLKAVQVVRDRESSGCSKKRRKAGPVGDHRLVLRALERALEVTENAYLEMTDRMDCNPELALMGSCLLVVLMRDEDVYVMNLGDSRAIVAQYRGKGGEQSCVREMDRGNGGNAAGLEIEAPALGEMELAALQLSTDHSMSIEEEVLRIRKEHPDDDQCIVNGRVKGRLKVTRAFGAGYLKHPKWNEALLEMFRNEYVGSAPYLSCLPSLCHHKLGASDQFLVLSSDGLYQYLSNEEVVLYVESFMERFPDGDPAQSLIEELLFRAAQKAGMGFSELLDIPQGDRRKYHDDVTVMVISLEGRIWKSSGKYV